MRNQNQVKYVRTTYQLFVYSLSFQNNFKLDFSSDNSGVQHSTTSQATSKIAKCFELSSVDIVYLNERTKDSIINLQVYSNQMSISTITFDIKKQKFVKADSKSLFRKSFNDKSGHIDYKFLTAKTQLISYHQFYIQQQKRNRVVLRKAQDYNTIKKQHAQYDSIKKEKDKLIQNLQQKLKSLIDQNINLNKKINQRPSNIMLNIHSKKDFAKNTDNLMILQKVQRAHSSDGRNIDRIMKQLQKEKQTNDLLKQKLYSLQVDNKKLQQKCSILTQGMNQFGNKQKFRKFEKKLAQVDSQYLMKKTISNYDKSFKKEMQLKKSIRQFNLLQISPQKTEKEAMRASLLQSKQMISSIVNKKYQKQKESIHKIRILTEFKQIKESMISIQGKQSKQQLRQASIQQKNIVQELNRINAQLQRKQKEIQILQNQLKKKQNTIDKLLHRQNQYEKQYQEYQQQKQKMFANLAISAVNSSNTPPEQIETIKKLTAYNSQLIKDRQKLSQQIKALKVQNNEKTKKIQNLELTNKKSLLFMSYISKEKDALQQRYKDDIIQVFTQKRRSSNDSIKQQLIECQQELKTLKTDLQQMSEVNARTKQENMNISKELSQLKLQNQRLKILVQQQNAYQSQIKILQDKYQQIQKLQKGLKSFVIRLQSQINSSIKKKDEQIYKAQMKSLMKETFSRINEFQDEYYQVLIDATKVSGQSIQRYYDSLTRYQEQMAQSIEKQEKMWADKLSLIKERDKAVQGNKQNLQNLIIKKQKKLLLIQDQFEHFMDSFKKVNNRINEMESYKLSLKDIILQYENTRQKSNIIINVPAVANSNSFVQKNPASSQILTNKQGGKNKKYRQQSFQQLQKSKFDDQLRLKQSLARHLTAREEMARERLQAKIRQGKLVEQYELKIKEIQKRIDRQAQEMQDRTTKRQQQLQIALNKAQREMEQKTQHAENQLAKITQQSNQLRYQVISLKQLLSRAEEELRYLQSQNKQKQQQNLQLICYQKQLTESLQDYQRSQALLIRQIKEIKLSQQAYQEEINHQLEDRSDKFLKIEGVKQLQIRKLSQINYQLQSRLQQQFNENIKNKQKVEELKEEININQSTIKQLRQQAQIIVQSLEKQLQNERDLKQTLQNENNEYHRHIIELSDEIVANQKEIQRLNIIIQAHNKEKAMLQQISAQFVQKQSSLKQQSKKIQELTRQKNQQIRKWENKFGNLLQEINFLQKQSQNTKKQSQSLKEENMKLKDQLFEKQREIILIQTKINSLTNEKGIIQINLEKSKIQIDQLSAIIVSHQNKIKELMQLNDQLTPIDKTNQGKPIEKSRRIRDDTDSFLDKSRQMKISRSNIGSSQKSNIENIRLSQGEKNKTLLVPTMKTNKMLNLPSVDSDPVPEEQILQIIEEHHQELNDTFFKEDNIEIVVKNQKHKTIDIKKASQRQPQNLIQSGVHIVLPEGHTQDSIDEKMLISQRLQKKQFNKSAQLNQSSNNAQLMNEIIRLKKVISELTKRQQNQSSMIQKNIAKSQRSFQSSNNDELVQIFKQKDVSKIQRFQSVQSKNSQHFFKFQDKIKQLQSQNQFLNKNIDKLKQEAANYQLYIEEVEEKLKIAEKSAEEQEKNVEELMKQIEKISQINIVLQTQIEKLKQECINLKQQHKQQIYAYQRKCQQLISENLSKENAIYELQMNYGNFKQKEEQINAKQIEREEKYKKVNLLMKQSQKKLKKYQQQYRKYQQESSLEILRLKEQYQQMQQKLQNKQQQQLILAQKYVELQEINRSLLLDLKEQEINCQQTEKAHHHLNNQFQSTKKEFQSNQTFRKNTLKKIQEMEVHNYQLTQQLNNAVKNANIQSQKWNIRLTAQKELSAKCQQKLKDKERIILELKNQIAVYNDQCDELKRLNETLNQDSIRAQRELKQIMVQYDTQLQTINNKINNKYSATNQLHKNIQNLLKQVQYKNRQIKNYKEQLKQIHDQNILLRNHLQVQKNQKNKIIINLNKQIQYEKDQCKKLQSKLAIADKNIQELNTKLAQNQQKINKNNRILNDKVKRLEQQNEQLMLQVDSASKKQRKQKENKKEFMFSILQGKLQQKNKQLQSLKSQLNNFKQTQQIAQSFQQEIEKLSNIIVHQKQKNNSIYQQLKQVVRSFNKLEEDYIILKQKNEKLKKANQSFSIQYRQIQRKMLQLQNQNEYLHQQNEELQKEISNMRFSRLQSFSKSTADTTIK